MPWLPNTVEHAPASAALRIRVASSACHGIFSSILLECLAFSEAYKLDTRSIGGEKLALMGTTERDRSPSPKKRKAQSVSETSGTQPKRHRVSSLSFTLSLSSSSPSLTSLSTDIPTRRRSISPPRPLRPPFTPPRTGRWLHSSAAGVRSAVHSIPAYCVATMLSLSGQTN